MIRPYGTDWTHCSDCSRVITNESGEHTCITLCPPQQRQDYAKALRDWQTNGLAECKAEVAGLTEGVE